MANYARVNKDNIVVFITHIRNERITDENGIEHEEWAFDHLYSTIPDSVGDRWIQTSVSGKFRVRYAGIGYTYNEELDAFIPPKPFESWVLNEEIANWESPVGPEPTRTEEQLDAESFYVWNEENGAWVLETPE